MYSLNVNFLKDRPEFQSGGKPAAKKKESGGISLAGQTPLYLGVAGALAAVGVVGGAFLWLNFEMSKLESQQIALDEDLSDLQADIDRAETAQRSEEHTSELQSLTKLVCRLLLEKKKKKEKKTKKKLK